ncbi:choice-of-anchor D domain-containing protein [Scleromatobacter humisilvae]|uniref:Choice-of-anchor D domain-containing protein n=1 Tax=Scleromatobacter humisilvae TaxID=2897159 RepID=A0A9X1YLC2_9BURK|nr:choice-of-anchor D domain-containing protein [Scleromatobacter humisilvae]MCK9688424.1 choice-of-anchor D domain-containing protein [Scleromatobacter humisilvae]
MKSSIATTLALLSLVGCGGGEPQSDMPRPEIGMSTTAHIESGKGGGGGGAPAPAPAPAPTPAPAPAPAPSPAAPAPAPAAVKLPPPMSTDAAAWAFSNLGSVVGTGSTTDIDFGRIQNMTPGGIAVGASRSATELIYNTSKKVPLTVTQIQITGANPGDFVISPQTISAAAATVLPANRDAVEAIQITFRPTAEGVRTANVVFTSVAGVVQIALTGTGLPTRPVLGTPEDPLVFLPQSAPATFVLQNTGGVTLVLNSISIGGANPAAFQITPANSGFSNCFAGIPIAPLSFCYVGVGVAPGATPPANATFVVKSNDPVRPELDVPLVLATQP